MKASVSMLAIYVLNVKIIILFFTILYLHTSTAVYQFQLFGLYSFIFFF